MLHASPCSLFTSSRHCVIASLSSHVIVILSLHVIASLSSHVIVILSLHVIASPSPHVIVILSLHVIARQPITSLRRAPFTSLQGNPLRHCKTIHYVIARSPLHVIARSEATWQSPVKDQSSQDSYYILHNKPIYGNYTLKYPHING